MFFLNMVDYPVFFPSMSTLTLDTIVTLSGTWGYLAHKILVSAPVPLELILTGFDWVGTGPWVFGFWDGAWQLDSYHNWIGYVILVMVVGGGGGVLVAMQCDK